MNKYRYKEVKNYIHNELKLTKEDIKEIMIPIVKEEVKRIFHNTYGNDVDVERWIRCMVSDEIQRHGDYSMLRNLCREAIKEEIEKCDSLLDSILKSSRECCVYRDAVRTSGDIAVITLSKYCTQYIIDGLYVKKCRLEQEFKEL